MNSFLLSPQSTLKTVVLSITDPEGDITSLNQALIVCRPIAHPILHFLGAMGCPFCLFRSCTLFLCHASSIFQKHSFNKAVMSYQNKEERGEGYRPA